MVVLGGPGIANDITGTNLIYGAGGGGAHHASPAVDGNYASHAHPNSIYSNGGNSTSGTTNGLGQGAVIVRYYIA
jgi:hypothetical protein